MTNLNLPPTETCADERGHKTRGSGIGPSEAASLFPSFIDVKCLLMVNVFVLICNTLARVSKWTLEGVMILPGVI